METKLGRDAMKIYLKQAELSVRWDISERTLEGFRSRDKGPGYVKFGSCVRYPIEEVERFERDNFHDIVAARNDRWAA